ncbi:MAG: hypothetical protein MUE78_07150 [Ilumatobacteraceae bacterium]|nr:hypothetical protein [Ilumatobacteraceae bacterium]
MNGFQHGDRIRVELEGDDGLPLVRYGFVDASDDRWPRPGVPVMLDGEIDPTTVIDLSRITAVTITNLELRLDGADLLVDPHLRRGLVQMWSAEAEAAGLEIQALHCIGDGVRDSSEGYVLAELNAGGDHYVLRATREPLDSDVVHVRADRPHRFQL